MNYYPTNFYSNYPYQNSYMQMQQQQQPQMNMIPQQQSQSGLNGRIVESIDVAKVAEVPLGGYGIFPKADLSEIYVKSWNNNGTTSIIPFRPYVEADVAKEDDNKKNYSSIGESNESLLEKMNQLEEKLNRVIAATEELKIKESSKVEPKRKELNASAY